MTSEKIPVSFDFFKKYTYHEECVAVLLKFKANGDKKLLDRLLGNKEAQERALKAYYEAFYLKPEIREKYHIRFKSAPKSIKDKLLSIPVQNTNTVAEQQYNEQHGTEIHTKDLDSKRKENKNTSTKRVLLATQTVDSDCIIDDEERKLYDYRKI